LEEIVKYADEQCEYIESFLGELGKKDTTADGTRLSSQESSSPSSTCSDYSFPSIPRRSSFESYSEHIAEYEAELFQPYVHLLDVASTKGAA